GECSLVNDLPTCDYPVDQVVDCAAQGRLCDAASAACVECLSDAHCVWPFEVCLAGLCAAGCQDDVGEPDDAAAEAGAIQPDDLLSDRVLCSGDEDWYQVALEQGDRFEVLLGFTHADGNLDLDLLGPDGVSLVASSHGGLDDELVDYTLPAGGSGTYFLRVFGVAGAHNLYSLLTARTDDPCLPSPCDAIPPPVCQGETLVTYLPQCLPDGLGGASCSYPASQTDCLLQGLRCNPAAPACVDCLGTADCAWPFEVCQGTACVSGCQDDAREENDAAATASAVTPGQLYPDLVACGNDDDWFSVSLAPQQTLRGRIDFTHAAGDLSLQVVGPDGSTVLATSATASDFEQAAATNTTAGAATHYVRVYGVAGAHNVYQLGATVLPDPCDPSPCTAVPPPACVGNILTTYQGVCANDLGAASCSYPPATQQDCTTSGGLCQASTCVGRFANAGDLVITEIMYDPNLVLDRYGEYVEVMSIAADTVNLRGLTFSDLAANNFSIGVDVFVAPGAYAVLGVSANLNQNGGAPVDWAWGGNQGILNNDTAGETVFLRRGATVVDQASYCDVGAGCFPSSPGASLQLDLDHADPASNDDPAFWCRTPAGTTYGDGDRGTPGADNTDCGVLLKLPI
ncbi:MAG TPA: lamin tail domain-containing protein, partial [Myxococcota bacterium]|nr:lamin tail domain-containing protein [Myxococcota bacterium]